jgi:hypothetical protein
MDMFEERTLYKPPLRRLLKQVIQDRAIPESTLWLTIYSRMNDEDHGIALIKGRYAEFVKDCPSDIIAWVVGIYEERIVNMRYCNADDVFEFRELPICPITGFGIKPLEVGTATIDALETVWERYIEISQEQGKEIRHFSVMMARLLNITLHLQWAGFSGIRTFDRKWEQLKAWKYDGHIASLAGLTMESFVFPPNWMESVFPQIMPVELRKQLYKELQDLYTTHMLDPVLWGAKNAKEHLVRLYSVVVADEHLDDVFKHQFRLQETKGMATKLDKPITREVTVKDYTGCEGVINVTITNDGITIKGKGTQRELRVSYADLSEIAVMPPNMPLKFHNNKLGWLIDKPDKHKAEKLE